MDSTEREGETTEETKEEKPTKTRASTPSDTDTDVDTQSSKDEDNCEVEESNCEQPTAVIHWTILYIPQIHP